MATKDQAIVQYDTKIYRSYRKDTPDFLIQHIISYLKAKYNGPLDLAVDVGCGSGQSTVNLASYFKKVYGRDVLKTQIQEARKSRPLSNVTYEVGPAEVIPFDDGTVQVVSAGASLHWFQLDTFFPEVRRVLCNNGVLAVYCYYSLRPLLENKELAEEVDKIWTKFYALTEKYHANQAKIAMDRYKDVTFPFEEVQKFEDIRDIFDGTLEDIIGYMSTFSGLSNLKIHEEDKAEEYLAHAEKRLREILLEAKLNPDGTLKLYRDYYVILCRKVIKDC